MDRTDYRFPLAMFDQPVLRDLDVAVRFKMRQSDPPCGREGVFAGRTAGKPRAVGIEGFPRKALALLS